jgi:hypothetical protein
MNIKGNVAVAVVETVWDPSGLVTGAGDERLAFVDSM